MYEQRLRDLAYRLIDMTNDEPNIDFIDSADEATLAKELIECTEDLEAYITRKLPYLPRLALHIQKNKIKSLLSYVETRPTGG